MNTEDEKKLIEFLNGIRGAQEQERKDFDQLWLNASKHIKHTNRMPAKDMAFEWFRIGYELAEHRQQTTAPPPPDAASVKAGWG